MCIRDRCESAISVVNWIGTRLTLIRYWSLNTVLESLSKESGFERHLEVNWKGENCGQEPPTQASVLKVVMSRA